MRWEAFVESVVHDPSFLPFRLDFKNRLVLFVRSDRASLDKAAFHDGRSAIGDREVIVELDEMLAAALPSCPPRLIVHPGFSGSTALARFSSVPGRTLSLREPQILVDLANWRAQADPGRSAFEAACETVLRLLHRPQTANEIVIVKPSNWANSILGTMMGVPDTRHVATTVGKRDYLNAILDGGKARLDFVGRMVGHFAHNAAALPPLIESALVDCEPLVAVLRLATLAHAHFTDTVRRSSPADRSVPYRLILDDPIEATRRTLEFLDVPFDADARDHVEAISRIDAKSGTVFSSQAAKAARDRSYEYHRRPIDAALQWAERMSLDRIDFSYVSVPRPVLS